MDSYSGQFPKSFETLQDYLTVVKLLNFVIETYTRGRTFDFKTKLVNYPFVGYICTRT